MEKEQNNTPEGIQSPQQWWNDPRIIKSVLQYLGGEGSSWENLGSISSEYLTVATLDKALSAKHSPASSIRPYEFEEHLKNSHGLLELTGSAWQKDDKEKKEYPRRILLVWDVEYYDHIDRTLPFTQPREIFQRLEPIFVLFQEIFEHYGILHFSSATGRGYHFVTQVPAASSVMEKLLKIGGVIEPTVAGKQAAIPEASKRDRPVPVNSELSFKSAVRLQQFLFNKIINQARRIPGQKLPIEISDRRERGIAFDNTSQAGTVDTRTIGVVGSLYFIKPSMSLPPHSGENLFLRVPRNGYPLDEVLAGRQNFEKAAELLEKTNCSVPDGSQGLEKLMEEYSTSPLRQLHQAMDSSFGDEPQTFVQGYRNYESIIKQTSHKNYISNLLYHANPALLQPESLDFFIWEIFKAWGGTRDNLEVAPHVAGLLRAIYEDPRFHWENRWTRHADAFRHARGWVEQILGQAFQEH